MKSKIYTTLLTVCLITLSLSAISHGNKNEVPVNPLFSGLDTKAAKTVTQFHEALQSSNVKSASSLLSKDVLIYESGNAERSSLQYTSGHMLADMKYLSSIKSELIEHQVKVYGDIAISTSQSKNIKSVDGKSTESITMETIVIAKINGQWLITHIHWS